ncbi:MAG TPA: CocE/NonD family hydrolase [Euzebyales bacterium]|nr:CocE/NonD family hydrolase [Euzebyales bacterium]
MRPLDRVLERLMRLPPAMTRDVTVQRDLPVRLRDGVTLLADRYAPAHDQRAPLMLLRTPYGRRGPIAWALAWGRPTAERGLQTVIVSTRGTGGSGGVLNPLTERDDGLDTIAWLRAQPWYPGRFALAGPSYLGLAQWAVADAAPGELVALVATVTASQFGSYNHPGGVLALEGPLTWTGLMAAAGSPRGPVGPRTMLVGRRLRAALRTVPIGELDRLVTGHSVDWWRAWTTNVNPATDAYWRKRDHRPQVAATTARVALIGGWDDVFLPWQLDDHALLVAGGNTPWLVVGPWDHSQGGGQVGMALTFLRAAFDGRAPEGGPVRLYVRGAGAWRDYPTWPVPGAEPTPLYLRPSGELGPAPEPAASRTPTSFTYDPSDPTPNVGGPTFTGSLRRRQDRLIARADVITFTGRRLDEPLEVIGPVSATVYLRSTVAHAQLFVRLCDVDERDRTWAVCDGIERVDERRWPAVDGVRRVRVELWPTARRFAPGHRIRVLIAGGAHPRFARAYGTTDPVASATRGVRARHEVLHDVDRPSCVVLPVMRLT